MSRDIETLQKQVADLRIQILRLSQRVQRENIVQLSDSEGNSKATAQRINIRGDEFFIDEQGRAYLRQVTITAPNNFAHVDLYRASDDQRIAILGSDASGRGRIALYDEAGTPNLQVAIYGDPGSSNYINGYLRIGPSAGHPIIRIKKLTGTFPTWSTPSVSIAHGVANRLKILACNVLVDENATSTVYPPNITGSPNLHYKVSINNTNVIIDNVSGATSVLQWDPITVLLIYEV